VSTVDQDTTACTTDEGRDGGERDFAERTLVGWHVLFGVMVVATAVILIGNGDGPLPLALLALLVVAYLGLALRTGPRPAPAAAIAYLAVAYTILCALAWIDPASLVLLFALYPQAFLLLPRLGSIIATVVLSVAWNLVLVARQHWTPEAWGIQTLSAAGNILFALVIGLFIDGLVRENRERKRLLAELHAAQTELASVERQAGALAERERLARDIHDTLAQGFTSIVMLSQAGEAAASRGDDATAARRFTEIQETARENLAEARALVGALAPPALAEAGLPGSLQRIVARYRAETGVDAVVAVHGEARPLAPTSEVTALRATQECLANARRHAEARHVEVALAYDEDGATVTVHDDGCGFDPDSERHGYGLDGLRARVESVGGLMAIRSEPGAGTTVRVRVP
jgi:signal transduction histidine kinase